MTRHRGRRTSARPIPAASRRSRASTSHVAPGEVFGLLGPNGAGKSTTIGMLTTTIAADRRQRLGRRLRRGPRAARGPTRVSSVVFQEAVVDRALTGRRNLELHARLWGVPAAGAPRRSTSSVDALGLPSSIDRPVGDLQRRRAAAARDRARARVRARRSCSSTSRRSGSTRGSAHELLDVIAGLRGAHETTILADHSLPRRGPAPVRPRGDHPRRADRRARHAAGAARAARRARSLEFRVRRRRAGVSPACARRGLAGDDAFAVGSTRHRPAARPARRRGARARSRTPACSPRPSAPAPPPSTTSTCG